YGIVAQDFNRDGRLDLATANNNDNTVSILLQSPVISVSPGPLNFGSVKVGLSNTQGETVTNNGSAALTITSLTFGGNKPGDFSQTNPFSGSIAPGASCIITVTFTPGATGTRDATLLLADNAGTGTQTFTLTGTGVTPLVTLSPPSLTFATQV